MIKIGLTDYTPEGKVIDINDKNGEVKARYAIGEKDILRHTLMEEHYIEISFELNRPVSFLRADYIIWEEEKYTLREDYLPEEVNKRVYKYTLRFEAVEMFFQDIQYYYLNQGLKESEWRLTGNPEYFIKIAVDNINRYFGVKDFTIGTVELTEVKDITFSTNTNTFDALTQVADEYEAEWFVTGKTLHLLKKVSFGSEIDFETETSVLSMKRDDGGMDAKYTRIVALGSSRNIPRNYRETAPGEAVDANYTKRLRIPLEKGDVIDVYEGMSPDEIVEGTVIFDEVYPKRVGTIEAVSTIEYTDTDEETGEKTKWNAYKFKDSGINFSEDYMLPGELRVVFESGDLIGRDFALKFHKDGFSETDNSQCFEIIRTDEYGKELPNETIKPAAEDKYVLYGFDISLVSDQYVPAAEQELYDTAYEWLQNQLADKSIYECPTVIRYFKDNDMNLGLGQRVRLISEQFKEGSRSSRVMGYEKKLVNKFDAVYTVGDNPSYSRFGKIEDEIKELQHAGLFYESTGGKGVYLIKEFDNTKATDFNAYSARRSQKTFLYKNQEDVAQELIKLLKGGHFGDFIDSLSAGMGAGIMPNGRGQFQTLEVRGALRVLDLIYNRIVAEESDRVFTEAGTVDKLEKIDDTTYRLTMRKQWENDFTAFHEGDVLRGIVNNLAKKGEYATSWLRVLSVNTTANTITVSMYPDSETGTGPNTPPTELMVLQRWGNTFDTDRQSTWYLSSREGRIVWLTGVTKPILEEHNYSSFYGKPVRLSIFEGQPIDYNEPYLYAKGILTKNLIRVDHLGNVIKDFRDRGLWTANPAEPYRNMPTLQDDVWHLGCKWRCLVDETPQEPKWNATHWQQIEGSREFTCELYPTNGEYFYDADVDFVLHWDVRHGHTNINDDIKKGDVQWMRDSGDIAADNLWTIEHRETHNDLHITNEDIGTNFDQKGVTFKVRIFVRDGEVTTKE